MELSLQRLRLDSTATQGDLSIDGAFEAHTLELPVVDGLPGSAIPPGTYAVILNHSPKFSGDAQFMNLCDSLAPAKEFLYLMPEVMGIPGRSEIRIHWGNTAHDTEGCILVGRSLSEDFIGNSRLAFATLYPKLLATWIAKEPISLKVIGGIPSARFNNRENVNEAAVED